MSLIVISIVWFVFEIVIGRTRLSSGLDEDRDRSSLRVIWITVVASIFAGVFLRNLEFARIESHSLTLYYAGIAFILIGLTLRGVAISTLKHYFTVNVTIREDHRLIREGLYKRVRHPAYTGSLISFFGLGLSFGNWLTLAVIFVPIFLAFNHRISIEEKVLVEKFGDEYRDYSNQTSRLVPGIY